MSLEISSSLEQRSAGAGITPARAQIPAASAAGALAARLSTSVSGAVLSVVAGPFTITAQGELLLSAAAGLVGSVQTARIKAERAAPFLSVTQDIIVEAVAGVPSAPIITIGKLAANRTQIPTNLGADVTATVPITYVRSHYASPFGAVSDLQLVDLHWYYDDVNRFETVPGSTVTFKRYLEYPAGVYWPVTWAGSATVTLADGGQVKSDPVAGLTIPAGAKFWERTVVTAVTGTGKLCFIQTPATGTALGITDGSANGDYGNSVGPISANTLSTFGAAAIIGTVAGANARSVVMEGDSLIYGEGDISGVGAKDGSSWSGRLFGPLMPWVKIAKPGQALHQLLNTTTKVTAFLAAIDYTEAVIAMGTNDFNSGQTLVNIQARMATVAAMLNKGGAAKIHQATLPPRTSGDWSTVAGQAPVTGGTRALLPTLNDWIRLGPAYLTGQVLDVGDASMSARNSGLWKAPPTYTVDGVHPNTYAATAIAATVGAGFV